jgi:hypothetical protein
MTERNAGTMAHPTLRALLIDAWPPWLFVALVIIAVAHLRLGLMSAVVTAAGG